MIKKIFHFKLVKYIVYSIFKMSFPVLINFYIFNHVFNSFGFKQVCELLLLAFFKSALKFIHFVLVYIVYPQTSLFESCIFRMGRIKHVRHLQA